jgi:phosphate transport system substrate-binding protein
MLRSRALSAGAAVAALCTLPAAADARPASAPVATASAAGTITMSGSTSVAPLAAKLARAYLKQYPGRVKFRLAQGGSDIGIADVAAGRVSIGNSSRDPKGGDPSGIFFNKVARDALCIATHPNNKIANLTSQQVADIFSGKVRDWSQVQGATATGAINLVVRTAASGTQDAFQKLFMGKSSIASSAAQKASNGLIQQSVRSDGNAIGYVSLAFTDGTNVPSYKGVACTLRDAKSGQYEGSRNFWMVTRGRATGSVQKFINWIQNSPRAAKVIATEWVPLQG